VNGFEQIMVSRPVSGEIAVSGEILGSALAGERSKQLVWRLAWHSDWPSVFQSR
jgi:hypothetical protein